MKLEALDNATAAATRFYQVAEQYRTRLINDTLAHFGCKESAAVRRASMDLTRALAELRRS